MNVHALEFQLDRVQRNGVGGFLDVDVDGCKAGKRSSFEIGRERKRIMRGNDIFRQALRLGFVRKPEKKTDDCGRGATISAKRERVPANFHRVPREDEAKRLDAFSAKGFRFEMQPPVIHRRAAGYKL
jgi:hypothetical protein